MYLFIWLFNSIVIFFIKLFGLEFVKESEFVYFEEELWFILGESFKSGEIN